MADLSKPQPPGTAPAAPADLSQAQANRLNAEAVKLVAEANESRVRQLKALEEIIASLQRNLAAEAERLKQSEQQLHSREAKLVEQIVVERQQAESARTQLRAAQQEAERIREESDHFQARLWPAALRGEPWRPWRVQLLSRADAPAFLLLARLHTAAALENSGRQITMELLRDLGRSVYETCPDDAQKLAQALNQAAAGQFEIRTVRPGDRIDNKLMKPSAPGLVEVRSVSGWSVRDAKGQWQFLAEVS
jgi:hypothetical protein